MPHPKTQKRKFLLDELLPPKRRLPKMCKKYVLKHIVHDFKKQGLKDDEVQKLAQKKGMTVITGDQTFVKRITKQTSVIKITGINKATFPEIDKRLIRATALYQHSSEYEGKIISITPDCVNERDYMRNKKTLVYKKKLKKREKKKKTKKKKIKVKKK